jgi:hypothetical protein
MVPQKKAVAVNAVANRPLKAKVAKPPSFARAAEPHPALVRHPTH